MQKKIIALAIATAMAAPAVAMAAPTVYGQVNMAYEVVDDGGDGTGVGVNANTRNHVSSNVSRIGVKGSEDLGSGLTGVFQMEGKVNVDAAGSQAFAFDRNTFLGVAGGFGTVVLGQHDTPYKMATRDMDMFKDSIADNRSVMGGGIHDTRLTDVLAYLTPDFGGFTAAVAIVGGTDNTLDPAAAPTTEWSATSLFAKFAMDKWSVVLANQNATAKDSVVAANKVDASATKVGGSFGMDMFSVNAYYEMLSMKIGAAGTKFEQNNIYVSGAINVMDSGKVKLAVTMAGEQKQAGVTQKGTSAMQFAVGYDHALSKSTTLFAQYTAINNDSDAASGNAATYGFTSSGSTADTAAGAVATGAASPTALSIGVRHSF
jgi:predicted porin